MSHIRFLKICVCVLGFVSLNACVKDSDLDVVQKSTSSKVESEFLKTVIEPSNFIKQASLSDSTLIDIYNSKYNPDQLKKANFFFTVINSIESDFVLEFKFLNALDEIRYQLQMPVSKGLSTSPMTLETYLTIREPEILQIKDVTKIVYRISQARSEPTALAKREGDMRVQVDATFFFESEETSFL